MKPSWEIELIKPEQKWENELIKPEQKWEITLNNKIAYTLPIASPEQLGGVKPDSKTSDMDIPVGVDEEGKLWTKDKIDETLSIKGFSADAAAVGEALKNIDNEIATAVKKYLDENPIDVGVTFEVDNETLSLENKVLSVKMTSVIAKDDNRPITSGAVFEEFSKAVALLSTI